MLKLSLKELEKKFNMGAILGKKIGMTRLFNDKREAVSCTIIEASSCFVTQVKSVDKDGYNAYQVGIGERKENRVSKPLQGHYKKAGVTPGFKLAEFDFSELNQQLELGSPILVGSFTEGEKVNVLGVSKGKGFAGVMKRHNFSGSQRTHGQSDRQRDVTRNICGTEVELRTISVKERSVTTSLFFLENVDLSIELGVRLDGARLGYNHTTLKFCLVNTPEKKTSVITCLPLFKKFLEHLNTSNNRFTGRTDTDNFNLFVDLDTASLNSAGTDSTTTRN